MMNDRAAAFRVPPGHNGRLDLVLPAVATEAGQAMSRRAVRRLIDAGAVSVNGRPVRVASRRVGTGAWIEVTGADGAPPAPVYELTDSDVLYRDRWLIAVAKPSGLPAQATPTDGHNHVEAAVRRYLYRSAPVEERVVPYVALHHRLDWGTSGIMVLATDRAANKGLASAFADRTAKKRYWAVVSADDSGPPDAWTEHNHLVRRVDDEGRWRIVSAPAGSDTREAETVFRRPEAGAEGIPTVAPGLAVVEARPRTGRLHQVRAHLAEAGWPVLGDRRYGGAAAARLMLHAAHLALPHPVTGETLAITCPAPADFPG